MRRDLRAWLFDAIEAGERVQRFTRTKTYADYQGDDLLRAQKLPILLEDLRRVLAESGPIPEGRPGLT